MRNVAEECIAVRGLRRSWSRALTQQVATDDELDAWVSSLLPALSLKETEETWDKIDAALARLQAITKGGATQLESYVPLVRHIAPALTNSLLSERTRLSGTASDVLNSMAPRLGDNFAVLLPTFIPPLLQLCSRTNRVAVKRAEKSLHLICRHCRPPGLVRYLVQAGQDKAPSLRVVAAGCIVVLLESTDAERLDRRVADLEQWIRSAATDASPEVRQLCRRAFALYAHAWPDRVSSMTAQLSPTAVRYLGGPGGSTLARSGPSAASARTTAARPAPATRQAQRLGEARPLGDLQRPWEARLQHVSRMPAAPREEYATPPGPAAPPAPAAPRIHRQPMPVETPLPMDVHSPSPSAGAGTSNGNSASPEPAEAPTPSIPPPPDGCAPSERVAYRLALAREQMRTRGGRSAAAARVRPASMLMGARKSHEDQDQRPSAARVVCSGPPGRPPGPMRVPSGGARRVPSATRSVSGRATSSMQSASKDKLLHGESPTETAREHAVTLAAEHVRRDHGSRYTSNTPEPRPATPAPESGHSSHPKTTTPRADFTPQRRPLSIVDENRASPLASSVLKKHETGPMASPVHYAPP